jgi:hypothetical protein
VMKSQHLEGVFNVPPGFYNSSDLNNGKHLLRPPCPDHIGFIEGIEGSFGKVDSSTCLSACKSPHVLDTGELKHFFTDISGNKSNTLRCRFESDQTLPAVPGLA